MVLGKEFHKAKWVPELPPYGSLRWEIVIFKSFYKEEKTFYCFKQNFVYTLCNHI